MKGVKFGNKHSFDDFEMILTEKSIGFPAAKIETVDINGMDGSLDLTDVVNDTIRYNNRQLSFVFTIIGSQTEFLKKVSEVSNYLHGKVMQIILDDDPAYYYNGRCSINQFKTDKRTATIQIDVDAQPYKMEINSAGQRWLWDPFSFYYGVIYTNNIEVAGTKTLNLINNKKIVSPTFTCSAAMTVTFDGATYNLIAGEQTMYDIRLQEGNNYVTFKGTGTVKIRYEGGLL